MQPTPPPSTSTLLAARSLQMVYGTGPTATHALTGVDLSIAPAESVAIMGPSGSGKTTLLHCLAGIVRPTSGSVLWKGQDIASLKDTQRTALRRSDFGFVFQSGQLLPELPAVENAALPLMLGGMPRAQAVATAAVRLRELGLAGMEDRRPGELSGGQAQRVAIARALVGSPGVIFADEPTGALDQTTGAEVMAVLTQAAARSGAALVVVTHDPTVARWCSRTVAMRDGLVSGEFYAPAGHQPPASAAPQATALSAQRAPAPSAQQAPSPATVTQQPGGQAR